MTKPNNKFRVGQWVLNEQKTVIFKVSDIRVYGESFGYGNGEIDGFFSEEDLIGFPVKDAELEEAIAYLKHNKKA